MKNKTIKNVGIILGCSITAKLLSYIWEATLAAFLGATAEADAVYMTTSIFGILYPILDIGIWKVFLPIYRTKVVAKEYNKADKIANSAITLFFLLSIALVLFLIVCAKPLVFLMAPGFEAEKKEITIQYLRVSAPAYFFMTTASAIGAILQSREKFLGSQIREIGSHVARISFLFVFYRFFGVYAALTALIAGGICRILIQLPFVNWKWKFKPSFNFKDPDIVKMLKGMPSVAVTSAINHVNGLINKMIASGAGSGAVACLSYGHKLMHVFSGTISTAVSTAVYPTIIQHIAQKNDDKLRELLKSIISALMFLIIPVSIFCFMFSTELVAAAFQRGAFDAAATALTAQVFVGYCVGMIFIAISSIVTNVFYGYGDTKITMYISLMEIALNVVLNLAFVSSWGVAGLAYAASISSGICLFIRFVILKKKYIQLGYKAILGEGIKIAMISVVACVIPYLLVSKVLHVNVYLSLIIGAAICGVIYLILAIVFRLSALAFVKELVRKKLKR